ncbi:MAG TPA: DUF2461 domain-containing protein [Polyangiaceae bacterium]
MAFVGFTARTTGFLAELSRHNERAWFEAHRPEYESAVIEPAKAFVQALGPRLRALDPKIQAVPRVNGSIKALERRMQFPRGGAAPYKDYLDVWFWTGRRRAWDNSGFFVRLSAERLVLAAGMVEFQKQTLARYREHVLHEARGPALAAVVAELRGAGYVVGGESYKKVPRGVPADHPRAALSKHGGLFATLEGVHPDELGTAGFVDYALSHFSRMAPVHAWLVGLG